MPPPVEDLPEFEGHEEALQQAVHVAGRTLVAEPGEDAGFGFEGGLLRLLWLCLVTFLRRLCLSLLRLLSFFCHRLVSFLGLRHAAALRVLHRLLGRILWLSLLLILHANILIILCSFTIHFLVKYFLIIN